jgi:hypothetical protein
MNVNEEFHKIDIETMRNSLMQGMSALAQSLPGMVQNGMDPTQIVKALAEIVRGKQKGKQIEDVIAEVFAPEPPPPAPGSAEEAGEPPAGPPGSEQGGGPLSPQQASLATEGPNGRPDLSQLIAGMSGSGEPQLGARVSRMAPVVGN